MTIQIHEYTNTHIHEYTNTQQFLIFIFIFKYTHTHIQDYTNTQICNDCSSPKFHPAPATIIQSNEFASMQQWKEPVKDSIVNISWRILDHLVCLKIQCTSLVQQLCRSKPYMLKYIGGVSMQCSNVTRPRKLCELVSKQLLIKRKKIGNILVENLGKFW